MTASDASRRATGEPQGTYVRKSGPIMQVCQCTLETSMTPYIETTEGVSYICGSCNRRRFRSWGTITGDLAEHLGLPLGRVS